MQDAVEPVYAMDAMGRIVYCNEAFAELVGRRTEEVVGKPSLLFYPSEAAPLLLKSRMEAMWHDGIPGALHTTLLRRGGAPLPVELRITCLESRGSFAGHLACVHRVEV